MKLKAQLGQKRFEVSVTELDEVCGCRQLEVKLKNDDGERSYKVALLRQNEGLWTFRLDSTVQDFIISQENQTTLVGWKNRLFPVQIFGYDLRQRRKRLKEESPGEKALRAQMPGKVIRVLKNVGDPVEEEEAVIIVEAMKMQNEISSPLKGRIVACDLREGDSVSTGDVLFKISG